ncbi:MAG: hypothetical protein IID44_04780 [Planctomycetes bacterium]|nr:hypothetical protein [Planctomycetota bacterium]
MSKTVEGVNISGYGDQSLAEDLTSCCSWSPIAKALMATAGRAGATIEVRQRGEECHADKTTIHVSRDACLNESSGLTSGIYMAESVLFELQNAVNANRYTQIRRDVRSGRTSVLQYGLRFATLEFESTTKIAAIVAELELRGKPVSPWGKKQRAAAPLGVDHFVSQPHVPTATDERRLPSKLLYAYSFLVDEVKLVKNMKVKGLKKLATVTKDRRVIGSREMGQLVSKWGGAYAGMSPSQFLVIYIDAVALLDNQAGWSVRWDGGTKLDWKTCATEFARISAPPNRSTNTSAIKFDMETV